MICCQKTAEIRNQFVVYYSSVCGCMGFAYADKLNYAFHVNCCVLWIFMLKLAYSKQWTRSDFIQLVYYDRIGEML